MTFYQLWNDESNNLISDFDTEAEALEEIRWRFAVSGSAAANRLSLVRFDDPQIPVVVALGDELLERARVAIPHIAAD